MKIVLGALALLALAPLGHPPSAHAQVIIEAPPFVGPGGYRPDYRSDYRPEYRPEYRPDYWRHREDREDEWHRRAEFREEEHRRWGWRRAHGVRDYRGEEYCRR